mmetsp:Transcript_8506/g.22233  ORF Transcript_8506/g.22233 Transcript_8506/m.22233 type:complete len:204 (+) Transcript_8506:278-889(+)
MCPLAQRLSRSKTRLPNRHQQETLAPQPQCQPSDGMTQRPMSMRTSGLTTRLWDMSRLNAARRPWLAGSPPAHHLWLAARRHSWVSAGTPPLSFMRTWPQRLTAARWPTTRPATTTTMTTTSLAPTRSLWPRSQALLRLRHRAVVALTWRPTRACCARAMAPRRRLLPHRLRPLTRRQPPLPRRTQPRMQRRRRQDCELSMSR